MGHFFKVLEITRVLLSTPDIFKIRSYINIQVKNPHYSFNILYASVKRLAGRLTIFCDQTHLSHLAMFSACCWGTVVANHMAVYEALMLSSD